VDLGARALVGQRRGAKHELWDDGRDLLGGQGGRFIHTVSAHGRQRPCPSPSLSLALLFSRYPALAYNLGGSADRDRLTAGHGTGQGSLAPQGAKERTHAATPEGAPCGGWAG